MSFFALLWIIISYLIGSIPFGLLIAKTFCKIDPREGGSKNVGSTNVARLCGVKYGVMTLICDILKGFIPVCLALFCFNFVPIYINLTALAAILGHLFSCYLKFKGGKAVATSIGVLIPLAFWQLLISAIACVLVIWRTGFVSAGSLTLVTLFPILLIISGEYDFLPLAIFISLAVWWSHRENVKRLIHGQEKPWIKKS